MTNDRMNTRKMPSAFVTTFVCGLVAAPAVAAGGYGSTSRASAALTAGFINADKLRQDKEPSPFAFAFTSTRAPTSAARGTQLNSIPTSFDVFTSGLTSICRLPFGVSVANPAVTDAMEGTDDDDGLLKVLNNNIRLKELVNIENSRDCRTVREKITEYDLCVDRVVSPTTASGTTSTACPTMIVQDGSNEIRLEGAAAITDFLDSRFAADALDSAAGQAQAKTHVEGVPLTPSEMAKDVQGLVELVGGQTAGLFRSGRGETVSPAAMPSVSTMKPLILYSYEGNQFCRLVREVFTELDIVYELRSVGKLSPRRSELAARRDDQSTQCPYLVDPNLGIEMGESKDIIQHLYTNYAKYTPPSEILQWASDVLVPYFRNFFAAVSPIQAGAGLESHAEFQQDIAQATASIERTIQSHPLVIYTYDLSPFCTEAKTILQEQLEKMSLTDEAEIHEVSLGYEWVPGLIAEGGAQKRQALFEMTGQTSLPHVFVHGQSVGGLFGDDGLIACIQDGTFANMLKSGRPMQSYDELLTDAQKQKELLDTIKTAVNQGGGGGASNTTNPMQLELF